MTRTDSVGSGLAALSVAVTTLAGACGYRDIGMIPDRYLGDYVLETETRQAEVHVRPEAIVIVDRVRSTDRKEERPCSALSVEKHFRDLLVRCRELDLDGMDPPLSEYENYDVRQIVLRLNPDGSVGLSEQWTVAGGWRGGYTFGGFPRMVRVEQESTGDAGP